jgi:gallate dioxygenase
VADPALNARAHELHRAHMAHQTRGAEELEGTYPFTLERSVDHYRINKLPAPVDPARVPRALPEQSRCHLRRSRPECRRARHDAAPRLARADPLRCDLFPAGKTGRGDGVSNLHIYAAMRGQSLEDFQKTRNTKALYSVAGKGAAGSVDWNKDGAKPAS